MKQEKFKVHPSVRVVGSGNIVVDTRELFKSQKVIDQLKAIGDIKTIKGHEVIRKQRNSRNKKEKNNGC